MTETAYTSYNYIIVMGQAKSNEEIEKMLHAGLQFCSLLYY